MKTKAKHIIIIFVTMALTFNGLAQDESKKGYTIIGNDLTFIFDVNDYPNIKNNGDTVDDVFVSGEFNDWAIDHWRWKMNRVSDTRYELTKKLYDFTSDFDWEFKFVVNGEHWAEPSSEFENITVARTETGKPLFVYNLKLYSAFASDNGNVTFKLKGYKYAKNVIVSGTFNRWDTNGFKMKRTDDGWIVTLQLRPNLYQYRFIVDGMWIEDPDNPSKIENEFHEFNSLIDVQKNIEFRLCDYQDAQTVILSGSFNDWSEDEYKLTKVNDCWVYNKVLSGGKYHYKYIIDGKWITDPHNSVKEFDGNGHINSVCMVK